MSSTRRLNKWGRQLVREVYKYWLEIKSEYDFSDYGFSVFYSPLRIRPKLMIIGFNPGGDEAAFDINNALEAPVEHEYFKEGYPLAKKSKDLFGEINKLHILKNSVKLNLYFIRSKNKNQFMTVNKETRNNLEKFCISKVNEIINYIQPQIILAEGIETYDIIQKVLFNDCEIIKEVKDKNRRRRVFVKSKCHKFLVLGLIHLSGARISNESLADIKSELEKAL